MYWAVQQDLSSINKKDEHLSECCDAFESLFVGIVEAKPGIFNFRAQSKGVRLVRLDSFIKIYLNVF